MAKLVGVCAICQMSAKGDLVDLIEIDAGLNRGIDEIRDLKRQNSFCTELTLNLKVYIIDEVHMLTKEAFNALLKAWKSHRTMSLLFGDHGIT